MKEKKGQIIVINQFRDKLDDLILDWNLVNVNPKKENILGQIR
jgi:hypothetical protein